MTSWPSGFDELDIADNVADGYSATQAAVCPQCQRPISPKHHRCLYCGYTPPGGDFAVFDQPTPESK